MKKTSHLSQFSSNKISNTTTGKYYIKNVQHSCTLSIISSKSSLCQCNIIIYYSLIYSLICTQCLNDDASCNKAHLYIFGSFNLLYKYELNLQSNSSCLINAVQ